MNNNLPHRILCFEDNPSDVELIKVELHNSNIPHEFLHVSTRKEFTEALNEWHPTLILLDYNIPGCDGESGLKLVLQRSKEIPVIFVTGTIGNKESVELIKGGASDLVLKSNLTRLPAAIVKAVKEHELHRQKKEAETKYSVLSNKLPDILWTADAQGLINYINPFGLKYFDRNEKEMYGNNWLSLVHNDDQKQVERKWANAQKTKGPYFNEQRMITGENKYNWLKVNASPILSEKGEIEGWVGNATDIQKEKSSLEKLNRSEQFNQNILSSLSSHIAVIDETGNIISTNESWKKFARKNNEGKLMGMDTGENYLSICERAKRSGDDIAGEIYDGIREVLSANTAFFSKEYPCHSPTNKRWFIMRVVPFEGGKGAVIAHENITERKLSEQQLKKALFDLNERVKEQTLLYKASKYFQKNKDIPHTLNKVVKEIPASMQFPEITVAKIEYGDQTFTSRNYASPKHMLEVCFQTNNNMKGSVEIGYTGSKVKEHQYPFLDEEHKLLDSLTEMTCNWLDKKQTEEELIRQKQFTEKILNSIPTDIAVFTPDHKYTFINKTAVNDDKLRKWLIGKTDFDYCKKRGADTAIAKKRRSFFNAAIQSGEEKEWVDKHISNSNKRFIMRRFHPVYKNGELRYVIGYGINITRRIMAEQMNRKSQEEQKLMADISQALGKPIDMKQSIEELLALFIAHTKTDHGEAWLTNIDNTKLQLVNFYHLNHESHQQFIHETSQIRDSKTDKGLPRETWKANKIIYWDDIGNKKNFLRHRQADKAGLRSAVGIPISFNSKVIGLFILLSGSPATSLKQYHQLFDKIRRRIGGELQRKKSETELETFFNLTPDLLCISDYYGNLKKVNPAFAELSGYSEEELYSLPLSRLIHPADLDRTIKELGNLAKGNTTMYFENRCLTKSGKVLWIAWTSESNTDEELIYTAARDITNQKKLNQELLDKQKEISRAMVQAQEQERQDLGQELHDNINQLLAASIIHLEMQKSKTEGNKSILNKSINYIRKAINESRQLSHQMKFKEDASLKELIPSAIQSINPENKKEVEYIYENIDEEKINKDIKTNIYRIIQEQLKNISQHARATRITVSLTADEKTLYLLIKDNGKGFDPEKTNFGIGIRNIRNRTELFNGIFELKSSPGKGCEIRVSLSLKQEDIPT